MRPQRRRLAVPALALSLACTVPTAAALQLHWSTGASLEFTDNIARSASAESEQVGALWAGVHLVEEGPMLRLGLSSVLEYRDYQQGTFDDEYLFDLSAQATASLIPRRLHWHLENYFRQIQLTDQPATPDNRQDANVFWTGPDVFFRFGPSTDLQLGARAGHNYYSESAADNYRFGGSGRLMRSLRPRLDGFLHGETVRVEYRDDAVTSFTRYDALAGFDYRMRATDVRIEGGHSWVDRDGEPGLDDVIGGLRIRRALPGDAEAGLTYTQQYTEAGASLLAAGADPMRADMVFMYAPRGLAYERRAEAHYARRLGMVDARMSVHWRDEESQVEGFGDPDGLDLVDEDRRLVGGHLTLGYRFNAQWAGGAHVGYRQIEYPEVGREDDEWLSGLSAEHRFTRHAAGTISFGHNRRSSNVAGAEFRENVLVLSLRYGERPPAVPL